MKDALFWSGLYTKQQLLLLYAAWAVTADLPTAAKEVVVAFPGIEYAVIKKTERTSNYGKRLYSVELHRITV